MLPSYEEYLLNHGDIIPDKVAYTRYTAKAAAQLRRYKRIYTVTDPDSGAVDAASGMTSEDRAVLDMAEILYRYDAACSGEGGPVSSAKIGSVSMDYSAGTVDLSAKALSKNLYAAAVRHLDIFRGA